MMLCEFRIPRVNRQAVGNNAGEQATSEPLPVDWPSRASYVLERCSEPVAQPVEQLTFNQ